MKKVLKTGLCDGHSADEAEVGRGAQRAAEDPEVWSREGSDGDSGRREVQ